MPLVDFTVRIDASIARRVDEFCRGRDIVKGRLVAQLLLDHLEYAEDAEDVERRTEEPTRSLQDVLHDLNLEHAG